MRTTTELFHQPFEGLVVAVLAGRVAVVGPVEGAIDVEGRAVGDSVIEIRARRGRRSVGDADLDGGVHVEARWVERDAGGVAVTIKPGGETGDSFRAAGEGEGPFVDELRVQAVHKQAAVAVLDGRVDGAGGEAVLDGDDDFLDGWEEAGDPLGEVEEDVVGVVADQAAVPGLFLRSPRFAGFVGAPDDGFLHVWHPPDAGELGRCPEIC